MIPLRHLIVSAPEERGLGNGAWHQCPLIFHADAGQASCLPSAAGI
jgi:hypothetical protein